MYRQAAPIMMVKTWGRFPTERHNKGKRNMVDKINFATWLTDAIGVTNKVKQKRTRTKRAPFEPPIYLNLTAAMVREYDHREIDAHPFARFTVPGTYTLTAADAKTVMLDAEWHGDVNGCSGIEGHSASVKRMYRRIYSAIKTATENNEASGEETKHG